MAPDDSPEAARRHRRESSTHKKRHHKKHRSRDHGSRPPPSSSEGTSSGARQTLSMDALAQLNQHNTQDDDPEPPRVRRESRPKKTRRRKEDYTEVDAEYESPRRERRAKREARGENEAIASPARTKHRRSQSHYEDDYYRSPRRERTHRDDYETEGSEPIRYEKPRKERRRRQEQGSEARLAGWDMDDEPERSTKKSKKKSRLVSGAIVEEGRAFPGFSGFAGLRGLRGGAGSKHSSYDSVSQEKDDLYRRGKTGNKKKKRWIIAGCVVAVLIIIIAVAVSVSGKNSSSGGEDNASNLDDIPADSVPAEAKGTYLDPFTWYDTTDFNVTYTNETVGDLPIMGLYTDWDDSVAANDDVPAINKDWGNYANTPARGVNLGGWLSLEPWITPSLFDYDSAFGIVDEYTLCSYLGPTATSETLEKHYATFVTEQTFADIKAAGLDHVRIPYSYWAVQTYDDEPYLFRTSWRYLLRGIEWARKHGLRIKLDIHGIPGSQNGWNHSGRLGTVNWLNGTDGDVNRQRSLDVHDRLSKFFAQDRYANIITFYGLANEPRMVDLPADTVEAWTTDAFNLVRSNGITAHVVFGDGFMGLDNWQGRLQGMPGLVLDVHQYVIFNNDQIVYTHQEKVQYACDGWTEQTTRSMNRATGFGPTMFAEWSQADTDCTLHLTNVGWGNRWEGTYDSGNASTQALTPRCPAMDDTCSCDGANADPSQWSSEYKQFLKMFAEAQMHSFEKGLGWFYWTWDSESAHQWSYKKGLAAGVLPEKASERDFNCDSTVPDFASDGLSETY